MDTAVPERCGRRDAEYIESKRGLEVERRIDVRYRSNVRDLHGPGQRAAISIAIPPATDALLTISAVFARTDAPSVIAAIRVSSQGVSSGPPMSAWSASAMARSITRRVTSADRADSAGAG